MAETAKERNGGPGLKNHIDFSGSQLKRSALDLFDCLGESFNGDTSCRRVRVSTRQTPSGMARRHSSQPTVSGDGEIRPILARQPYIVSSSPLLNPPDSLYTTESPS